MGGGRDGEGVVANTHAPNRECKVGEELIARREKGRDERGSAKGESETGKEEKTKRERGLAKDRVAQAPRD